jgi:hypothetical protein
VSILFFLELQEKIRVEASTVKRYLIYGAVELSIHLNKTLRSFRIVYNVQRLLLCWIFNVQSGSEAQ